MPPPAGVIVVRESLRFDCSRAPASPCTLTRELTLENPTAAAMIVPTLDAPVPPGGRATVHDESTIGFDVACSRSVTAPVFGRHVLLGAQPDERDLWVFPLEGARAVHVEVLTPPDGHVTLQHQVTRKESDASGDRLDSIETQHRTADHGKIELDVLHASSDRVIYRNESIVLEYRKVPTLTGGPLFRAGSILDLDMATTRTLLHAGYEIGGNGPWLVGAGVETDFHSVSIVPMFQAATVLAWMIPAVGVGIPIRLDPAPSVGVRAQAEIGTFPGLAFVADFDWFSDRRSLVIAAQVSL